MGNQQIKLETKSKFLKMKNLPTSKNMNITTKRKLKKNIYVWSVILCGSETWTINKKDMIC